MTFDITTPEVTFAPGLELLDSSDVLIEDITADMMLGGFVARDNTATIHGYCRVLLKRELAWSNQRLRPYVTLTDLDGNAQRYDLGVFLPETPNRVAGESPHTFDVRGYDKLAILNTPYGSTYEVASGAGYVATVEALLAGETYAIDQTEVAATLPSGRVWPIDQRTTTLSIINELLAAIGYVNLYVDRDGTFKAGPWITPASRGPVYAYDIGSTTTIMYDGATLSVDLFDVPNRWVFIRHDPSQAIPSEGAGIYTTANQSDGPGSIDARGRTINKIVRLDAADQDALVSQGDAIVDRDKQPLAILTFATGPNPKHWHDNTLTVTSAELGYTAQPFAEQSWSLPLDGGPMRHKARKV